MQKVLGIGKVTSSNRIPISSVIDHLKISKGDYVKLFVEDEEDENAKVFIQKV